MTTPDEIRSGDQFGQSVAISGGTVLVGRPGTFDTSGSAYLYRRVNDVWRHVASLNPSDSAIDDAFGRGVSLSGSVAIVGAPNKRTKNDFPLGSAYLFREVSGTWVEEYQFSPGEPAGGRFAARVSIAEGWAVAGAPASDEAGNSSGSAYVFQSNGAGWSSETKLLASDGAGLDHFGLAVSTDGHVMMVGAPGKNGTPPVSYGDVGAAYLFAQEANQLVEQRKLVASDAMQVAPLGGSVGVEGDYAIAGATESVYVFVTPSAAKNLRDFAEFQNCFRPVDGGWTTECAGYDLVPNGLIDLRDFDEFLATLAGP